MQRFYQGDPERWWEMPQKLLNCYIHEMPMIEAEEKLNLIEILWVATPSYDEEEVGRKNAVVEALREFLTGEKAQKQPVPPAKLAEAGLGVTRSEKLGIRPGQRANGG